MTVREMIELLQRVEETGRLIYGFGGDGRLYLVGEIMEAVLDGKPAILLIDEKALLPESDCPEFDETTDPHYGHRMKC